MATPLKPETIVPGISASSGIAYGQIFVFIQSDVEVPNYQVDADKRVAEIARFEKALLATRQQITKIKNEVDHYSKVRDEVRLASGDYIDLKAYEPAMRHLIDT